jgi:protein-tyrosine phosphatase
LSSELSQGKNIAIHCYAGIGRTGMVAAGILMKQGQSVDLALLELSRIRGLRVPETLEQITWLHRHEDQI